MTGSRYHVFLSYNEQHRPAVEELAKWLVREGLMPFFDWWHLIPGTPRQEALEDALIASDSCAVVLGAGEDGIGPWQEVQANQEHY
jgi:nucleotide-binding universal stress UspA family protein